MTLVHRLNPTQDPRWPEFIQRHPHSSIFHTKGWMEALRRTYGFEPVVLTTSPPHEELRNGIALCRINSWLTGRRLVSLPFSDHCDPLVDSPEDLTVLLESLRSEVDAGGMKHVELRPRTSRGELKPFNPAQEYCFHTLDLHPPLETLMQGFHKNCVQRKIRRAERDRLTFEVGRSGSLLNKFYDLQLLTRQRHQLPPQPLAWFRNLADCLGDAMTIRVASLESRAIAAILTLEHGNTLIYKYGCSDTRFNNLGGTQSLFWKAIQDAKLRGLAEFDMGRSDMDNPGLATFKDRWGTKRSQLIYLRYPVPISGSAMRSYPLKATRHIFSLLPNFLLPASGKFLYRHLG